MRIFRHLDNVPADFGSTVLSIGNFDGVHRAHQHVLSKVVENAEKLKAKSMAVTFEPHPLRVLRPEIAPPLITPLRQKLAALGRTGIDSVLVLPFDKNFSSLSPRDFAQEIIAGRLKAKEVHEGVNFHFGHRAAGNCDNLKDLGQEFGFQVVIYPEMRLCGEPVSSSRVRQLLAEGMVGRVRHLLGRAFSIVGSPAKGRGYGSKFTVPTVNLAPYPELVPRNGVYVTCTRIGNETFQSVTNLGTRPTFEAESFAIETHLLNFHPIALDESTEIEITFLRWLRPEMKWPSVEALKEQIGRDVKKAKRFFALMQSQ
jgi:riboflavin kinase / FMN adenylyltransferase